MLGFLEQAGKLTDRKARFLSVACCHRIRQHLMDERLRRGLQAAEAFADGDVTARQMGAAFSAVLDACMAGSGSFRADRAAPAVAAVYWAVYVPPVPEECLEEAAQAADPVAEAQAQIALLRFIFGNPFRPVVIPPTWRTPAVLDLARLIYDEKKFESMPVLGMALSDAGCTDAAVLGHCVAETPHVRGCHVLDLILGRE
jgi:hypothetical protein